MERFKNNIIGYSCFRVSAQTPAKEKDVITQARIILSRL